jgi:MoaA/NifB/PqqE/SkfB family radical SAM enzyme
MPGGILKIFPQSDRIRRTDEKYYGDQTMKVASPEISTVSPTVQGLSFLWLEITQRCNLTCQHCYAGSSPGRPLSQGMARNDWFRVISEASTLGCKAIQFIGGEPTLHPDLPDLIQHSRSSGFEMIEVFTNATTLNEARLQLFQSEKVSVACSFYSDDEAVHDSITRQRGSFLRTKDGIVKALAQGIDLRVGIIEMELNSGHHDRAASLLRSLGVNRIGRDRIREVGRGTAEIAPRLPQYGDICGHCWKGKLCVTDSGDAYPCIMARKTCVGNVMQDALSNIVDGRSLTKFRDEVQDEFERMEVKNCTPDCSPSEYCSPFDACSPKELCYPANICGPQQPCAPRD